MIAPVSGPGAAVIQEVKKTLPFSPLSSVKMFSKRFQSVKVFSKYFLSVFKVSKCSKCFQSVKGYKMFSKCFQNLEFPVPSTCPTFRHFFSPLFQFQGAKETGPPRPRPTDQPLFCHFQNGMTDFCSMFVSKVSFVKRFYFIRLSEERERGGGMLLADRRGYPRMSGDTRISSDVRGYQVMLWCQGIPGYPLISGYNGT